MKVLILPSWYFNEGSQELAGRMFHHLAGGLQENGIDAHVLYSNYSIKGPLFKREVNSIEEGVPTWRFSQLYMPKLSKFLLTQWQKKCVSDILHYMETEGKPDLIHAHSYPAAGVAAALQSKVRIPFIYTERLSSIMTNAIPLLHQHVLQDAFNAATCITGVSPGMVKCLQHLTKHRVELVPNFYDPTIFYPEVHCEKFNVFTWLSIGEPSYIKGLDILLHAFAELKVRMHDIPMQLILMDDIPQKAELLRLAELLHIEKDIRWEGLLPQREVARMMNKSHVLVSSSRVETFGKAIVEALACGLPVVATKTEGAQYIMTSADQGELAEPGSAESLVTAMQRAMMHYATYSADKISEGVKTKFAKEVVLQEWISLYNSLLS